MLYLPVVSMYSVHIVSIVYRISDRCLPPDVMLTSRPFQATDVSWRLNLRLAQSSSHKVKAPNALFEINVASNGNNSNSTGVRTVLCDAVARPPALLSVP